MLSKQEIIDLLQVRGADQKALFEESRSARAKCFDAQVVVRGVIEVTNVCRVNCHYCPMRRDNNSSNTRFLLTEEDLIAAAKCVIEQGLKVVFFQGGEAPQTTRLVGEAIPKIHALSPLQPVEILLNLGNKSRDEYGYLKTQGAESYILKHETSDPLLHKRLRQTDLQERIRCLLNLLELQFKVGTGTIIGLPGQTLESIADDIVLADELGVSMASASPFIPARNTPLDSCASGSVETTLNAIAIMRIANPRWLIPSVSALEKLQEGGQRRGLEAGANVLTVNFTPDSKRDDYEIYGKDRFIVSLDYVRELLKHTGLKSAELFSPGHAAEQQLDHLRADADAPATQSISIF